MAFQNGFNGGLAGFQYITDSQDRLRQQRIQDDAIAQDKAQYADKQQRQAQDDEFAKVGRISALIASAPTPQARAMIYGSAKGSLAGFAQQHGLPLPEQWDESLLDEVQQMAQMLGASKGEQPNKWQNLGNGWVMDGQGNPKQVYDNARESAPKWQYVPDPTNPDKEVFARTGEDGFYALNGQRLDYGGGSPAAAPVGAPAASGGAVDQLLSLGTQAGVAPSSGLRSPAHNIAVGGKPNSQHLAGTAMDFPVAPQNKAAFMALVAKNPDLMAIDEGDHIHVQQRKGGSAPKPSSIPGSRLRYKPSGGGGEVDARGEQYLRKEYQDLVKEPQTVLNAYNKVKAAGSDPSAAGDLSMIFAYMKMLDPNSVVREQEFANAQNAAGVPDQVRNLYNRAISGQRLNPHQRADFINQAGKLASQAHTTVDKYKQRYSGLAERYKFDPENIVFSPYDEPAAPTKAAGQDTRLATAAKEINTQAEFDALPSGALYIDNGKQYRKP